MISREGMVVFFSSFSFLLSLHASAEVGKDWTRATSAAAWSPRFDHSSVSYDAKIWVTGGQYHFYDVWCSSDGSSWTLVQQWARWGYRWGHTSLVYSGKMWVIGGYYRGSSQNDVWHSIDGISWTTATLRAQWSPRLRHASVVHNGKMWVLGGASALTAPYYYFNDVWHSTDGVKWTSATMAAGWRPTETVAAVSFQNKLWLINGFGVWCTSDGSNWTTATTPAPWGGPYYPVYWREGMKAVVCAGRIWVMGGVYPHVGSYSDVWSSSDGRYWTRVTARAPWRPRTGHAVVVHDGKIWVLGGEYVDSKNYIHDPMNDVWYSVMPTAVHPWRLYP